MRNSRYWDDFKLRSAETINAINAQKKPPVRRVAVFITDKCNFKCLYCNHKNKQTTMGVNNFRKVVEKYGDSAIIHITGGEPSVVPWLYRFIKENGHKYKFHLDTNAYIKPPARYVRRLKISLDGDSNGWDCLVGRSGAFKAVVDNIKKSIPYTDVSITYTLTKNNYKNAINFAKFTNKHFKGLYAVFFSVYKGESNDYAMSNFDADVFFNATLPQLYNELEPESVALLKETIDEKRRLMRGVRFSQNMSEPCYLSMSERVVSPEGDECTCSHLYRDGIYKKDESKHSKCLYGCNQRLVAFNQAIEEKLRQEEG